MPNGWGLKKAVRGGCKMLLCEGTESTVGGLEVAGLPVSIMLIAWIWAGWEECNNLLECAADAILVGLGW